MKTKFLLISLCSFSFYCLPAEQKSWTVLIYIAGDNDLDIFVDRNLKQMQKVGSNEHINIVAQVNIKEGRNQQKVSKMVLIKKDSLKILEQHKQPHQTDSGNPQNLISFCAKAIAQFPADHYALIFWNHGTGPLDPHMEASRTISISDLLKFGKGAQQKNSSPFFHCPEIMDTEQDLYKGICFDDSTGNFFTEAKLLFALQSIHEQALEGKKFDLIGFDACLMATAEIASLLKPFARYMVASQEVELGTGWDYKRVFLPFQNRTLTPEAFGKHIVNVYAKTYHFIDDFTLSCLDLEHMESLEKSIKELALLLYQSPFPLQDSLLEALRSSRYKHACTHFDEPDLIDLQHFLSNLKALLSEFSKLYNQEYELFSKIIAQHIFVTLKILEKLILEVKNGRQFDRAGGLSIYFPEHTVHHSYHLNSFAYATKWISFLNYYVAQ